MPAIAFDLILRRPLADGRPFGDVGPYEELKGRLRFAVDPAHPANARITDVGLAPRNAAGRVEFAADVSIVLPVDRARANGRLLVDVVNRGNTVTVPNFNHATRPVFGPDSDPHPPIDAGDGFLMRRGYTVVSCGWQDDLPGPSRPLPSPRAPGRRCAGAAPPRAGLHAAPIVGARDRTCCSPTAVTAPTRPPISTRRTLSYRCGISSTDAATVIPRQRWRFARVADGAVVPDPNHVYLDGGFEKGRLYQIAYTAIGAPVLGLGIAALRDCASWLKHGGAADGNPAAGALRYAVWLWPLADGPAPAHA